MENTFTETIIFVHLTSIDTVSTVIESTRHASCSDSLHCSGVKRNAYDSTVPLWSITRMFTSL